MLANNKKERYHKHAFASIYFLPYLSEIHDSRSEPIDIPIKYALLIIALLTDSS